MIRSKAIAAKCLDCSGGSSKEVTLCQVVDCPLWQFRFGTSLKNKGFAERMDKAREQFPLEFTDMLKAIRDGSKNIADKRLKAYVATFLQKNSKFLMHSTSKDG